ncbi:hypothetical protein Tco_0188588 [Tanacetum coccineum]
MSDSEHSAVTYTSASEDDLYMGSPGVECWDTTCTDLHTFCSGALLTREFLTVDDEEDDEEDPEEDPADYPADRGDDDDDALALAEPAAVAYSADQDPYIAYRVAARMSIRTQAPTPFLSEEVAERGSLGSRAAGIRQRDALPVHETEIPEMWLPLRKRLCRTTPGPRCEADLYGFTDMLEAAPECQMSRELGYGIRDTWDDLVGAIQEIAPTTLEGVNQRVMSVFYVDLVDEDHYSHLVDAGMTELYLSSESTGWTMIALPQSTALLIAEDADYRCRLGTGSMDACDQSCESRLSEAEAVSKDPKIVKSLKEKWRKRKAPRHPEARPSPKNPPLSPTIPSQSQTYSPPSVTGGPIQAMIERVSLLRWQHVHEPKLALLPYSGKLRAGRNERTIGSAPIQDFMKCQPYSTQGTEGVLQMTWSDLKKDDDQLNIVRGYEIKKIEVELWNLKVQGTDVTETAEVLKRFLDYNQTQQPNKRQNSGRAYAAENGDRRPYEGAKPRCPKCNFNHYGPCTPSCTNCKKPGHLATMATTGALPPVEEKNQGNGNGVAGAYAVGSCRQKPRHQRCDGLVTRKKEAMQDVPIVKNFPMYFPVGLAGPSTYQKVEFHFRSSTGAAPVAWAPYDWTQSEMKELADQLQELSNKGF